jgi:aminopeptidase N
MTHRRWLLYDKGPLVLHALRQELARQVGSDEEGDVYFFALLRSFVTNFPFQFGETRHLVGILNQMTGSDWQPWFERYVYGTETPPVEIR